LLESQLIGLGVGYSLRASGPTHPLMRSLHSRDRPPARVASTMGRWCITNCARGCRQARGSAMLVVPPWQADDRDTIEANERSFANESDVRLRAHGSLLPCLHGNKKQHRQVTLISKMNKIAPPGGSTSLLQALQDRVSALRKFETTFSNRAENLPDISSST
jgi:hypothetical protein